MEIRAENIKVLIITDYVLCREKYFGKLVLVAGRTITSLHFADNTDALAEGEQV